MLFSIKFSSTFGQECCDHHVCHGHGSYEKYRMLKVKYIDKREPINVEVMVVALINFNTFSGAASGVTGGVV